MKLMYGIVIALVLSIVPQRVKANDFAMTETSLNAVWSGLTLWFAFDEYTTAKKLERARAANDSQAALSILVDNSILSKKIYAFLFCISGITGFLKLWENHKRAQQIGLPIELKPEQLIDEKKESPVNV